MLKFNFKILSKQIEQTHSALQNNAVNAVNKHITLRNWLIGYYIVEFEQKGDDRAKYGDKLLEKLETELNKKGLRGFALSELHRYRKFYLTYASIVGTASQLFKLADINSLILGTVSPKLNPILSSITEVSPIVKQQKNTAHFKQLFNQTSFSHFVELIKIEDEIKRNYYELLILHTQPTVRELRRAIHTLSFERTGLSKNKKLSTKSIAQKIKPSKPTDIIKDFYFLDFLDLKNVENVSEQTLEDALINHLQHFILELGHGFCFEGRQKRILIGDDAFEIDLVFYHRILKCHVLIELKVDAFNHAHASQLRNYVKHYNKKVKQKTDNPTIGILLVTNKNKTIVEYTLEGIDEKLFVSKYSLQLPSKKELEAFIKKELKAFV